MLLHVIVDREAQCQCVSIWGGSSPYSTTWWNISCNERENIEGGQQAGEDKGKRKKRQMRMNMWEIREEREEEKNRREGKKEREG